MKTVTFPRIEDAELAFIRRNYLDMTDSKMSMRMSKMFGAGRWSPNRVKRVRVHYDMVKGRTYSHAAHKVGTIRVYKSRDTKVKVIKVSGNPGKWVRYGRYVWEQQNGPLPKGHSIIHLNGDPLDCGLENLACVTVSDKLKHAQKSIKYDDVRIERISTAVRKAKQYAKRKKAAEIYLAHKPYEFAR